MKKILITLTFILTASVCSACSVGPDWSSDPKVHFENSEVVFVGTVTDFEHQGDINGTFLITFDVGKVYRGSIGSEVVVKTGANSAMCGYDNPDIFKDGSVWSIYATNSLNTSSITANKSFSSIDEAILKMNEVSGEDMVACPLNYDPVCGRKDTGIRCVTTPCPSTEDITYGNTCALEADKAEFLYEGVCKEEEVVIETEVEVTNTEEEVIQQEEIENDFEFPETNIPNTQGFWNQFVDFVIKVLTFNF